MTAFPIFIVLVLSLLFGFGFFKTDTKNAE